MNKKERVIITIILLIISIVTFSDLITDNREGMSWWHTSFEALVAIAALFAVFLLIRGIFILKETLKVEKDFSANLIEESKVWKDQSKKYIEGLSISIDSQLKKWELTKSEKEVAFLLLKGFSLKEVAEFRGTTEKTARSQSVAVYAKANLTGRSQLSAFFLEDLLPPPNC